MQIATNRIHIVTTVEPWNSTDFIEDPDLKMKIFMGEESCCKSLRSVGWFATFSEAERIVKNNVCDIYEDTYKYAVIESTPVGIYPMAYGKIRTEFKFYRINEANRKYEYYGEDIPQVFCFGEHNQFPTCLG